MSFDWGNWTDSNSQIDLNPNTSIGYGSQAPKFDPDQIESTDATKKVVETMSGEQDTGDADDEVLCSVHCKVYNLENGKYVERGKGKVNVNRFKVDTDGEEKVRGRILCRRDTIMTMLINAPILKDMTFEKDGKFLRFGVVEAAEKKEDAKKAADEQTAEDAKDEEDSDSLIPTNPVEARDAKICEVENKVAKISKRLEAYANFKNGFQNGSFFGQILS